jgi:hypothetical protein
MAGRLSRQATTEPRATQIPFKNLATDNFTKYTIGKL